MLLAEEDVAVVLGAIVLEPNRIGLALVGLKHRPRTGQRMVVDRDLVVQRVGIGLVKEDAFLDDALAVLVKRHAARLVSAGALEAAALDLQHVVLAGAALVDP